MTKLDFYTNIMQRGNFLYVRGILDGKEVRDRIQYSPTLYIDHVKDYGFKTIYGNNIKPVEFDTIDDMRDFVKQHKGSNLGVYGFPYLNYQYALDNYSDSINTWNRDHIRQFNIDIEVMSNEGFPEPGAAAFPITAICIHDSVADKFVTFGDGAWSPEKSELAGDLLSKVRYVQCKDEFDLIKKFTQYWTTFMPNVVTGWNIDTFDIPYIVNRMNRIGLDANKLSPWGKVREKMIRNNFGEQQTYIIQGIDQLDYLPLYKKNKVLESYRLDFVGNVELGEKKLDYSESSSLHDLYFNNYQKYIDYNIQDVNLVKRLDEKLGLIVAQIMIAYEACMNFADVISPVRTWDCLINKEMSKENRKPPYSITDQSQGESIPGGFVKEPKLGKNGWLMSFDLASLYPHLIMQFNISPETLMDGWQLWPMDTKEERVQKMLRKEEMPEVPLDHSISAAGYAFDNESEGIIPRLMGRMYNERKVFKKTMLEKQRNGEDSSMEELRQYILKIMLNSGYGAFINRYFRWYDQRLGESITLSGQMLIQVAEREINLWMNKVLKTDKVDYIIAIDTDSNYVNVQPLVDKYFSNKEHSEIIDCLDKIGEEQISKVLENGFEEAKEYTNAFAQKMLMEREAIASSAFWTAKKRYAMCVWDMEGVRMPADKPKLKIQGLEAIRSSTPESCREALLEMINKTLLGTEEEVQAYIADFRKEFNSLSYEKIAFPRTMNNIKKFTTDNGFVKGTPIHVRGAVAFNRLLDKNELAPKWEKLKDGEKGKYLYLLEPNNIGTNVLSFSQAVPEEFAFEKYVDYKKMFEKAIVDPMTKILDPLGWSVEKRASLMDFFG